MAREFEIRVYGRRRKKVDPRQLAQILILLGRHLYEQQQAKQERAARRAATTNTETVPGSDVDGEPDAGEVPGDE